MISSRTPGGEPNHCPTCGADVCIDPSRPLGDAPCPNCGTLLWFVRLPDAAWLVDPDAAPTARDRLIRILAGQLGISYEELSADSSPLSRFDGDSLNVVELVMEFEDEFGDGSSPP